MIQLWRYSPIVYHKPKANALPNNAEDHSKLTLLKEIVEATDSR